MDNERIVDIIDICLIKSIPDLKVCTLKFAASIQPYIGMYLRTPDGRRWQIIQDARKTKESQVFICGVEDKEGMLEEGDIFYVERQSK